MNHASSCNYERTKPLDDNIATKPNVSGDTIEVNSIADLMSSGMFG